MLVPEVKSLMSPDLGRPSLPDDPQHCSIFCEATIGSKDSVGEEIFGFTVVTPSALTPGNRFQWGRGLLIVTSFSWEIVDLALARLLAHASRDSWHEVAQELNKNLYWEFENYREAEKI
jgi:Immunity protein 8